MNPLSLPISEQYRAHHDLNLYNSPRCSELATQATAGRFLKILSLEPIEKALPVRLVEDNYPCWLSIGDLDKILPAPSIYTSSPVSRREIEQHLPDIIAFTENALRTPNYYLWGGTLSPNYDCSGLMQAAFSGRGIWLPRDSYQQRDFCEPISREELSRGDLIFFGKEKIDHVALYLGDNRYIHSSGKEKGRNGIAIDVLSPDGDAISRGYYERLSGFGRVTRGFRSEIDTVFDFRT